MKVSTVFFLSFLATTSTSTSATNADAVQYDDVHRLRANNDDNNHARRLDDCVSASKFNFGKEKSSNAASSNLNLVQLSSSLTLCCANCIVVFLSLSLSLSLSNPCIPYNN